MWPVQRLLCAATLRPMLPQIRATSTMVSTYSKYPSPAPPYSSGTKHAQHAGRTELLREEVVRKVLALVPLHHVGAHFTFA